jgi:tRNA A-37 threonylcarbamoyl transferase component Bud32
MCCFGTLHFINSYNEGLNSIETALAYIEQQREATATDVLLFRRWFDPAAKKRKEAQKQIPITDSFKK